MIIGALTTSIVGIICITLGIINMKGNISSIHSYHRARVSEDDRIPFGRLVGLGTVIIGIGVILMGISTLLATILETEIISLIGASVLIISIILGCALSFYAMKKYNGGIF